MVCLTRERVHGDDCGHLCSMVGGVRVCVVGGGGGVCLVCVCSRVLRHAGKTRKNRMWIPTRLRVSIPNVLVYAGTTRTCWFSCCSLLMKKKKNALSMMCAVPSLWSSTTVECSILDTSVDMTNHTARNTLNHGKIPPRSKTATVQLLKKILQAPEAATACADSLPRPHQMKKMAA